MSQDRKILLKVLEKIKSNGIAFHTETSIFLNKGEAAAFNPNFNDCGPFIWLKRNISGNRNESLEKIVGDSEKPIEESINLAHELGHYFSFLDGHRTEKYLNALNKFNSQIPLEIPEKESILSEENRAWDNSEKTLREVGFTLWDFFKIQKTASIDRYKKMLGISSK